VLEKGLHVARKGNVGLVLAGPGVGKSSFLVASRSTICCAATACCTSARPDRRAHARALRHGVGELRATTKLEDGAVVQGELEHLRAIRAVPAAGFGAAKLREAVQLGEATVASRAR